MDTEQWKKQRDSLVKKNRSEKNHSSCLKDDTEISEIAPQIVLEGGVGVGRVTKRGLSQKIGEAAINPVPKAMILKATEETADKYHYEGQMKITILFLKERKIAQKTFNPKLGIQGGISILGTSASWNL